MSSISIGADGVPVIKKAFQPPAVSTKTLGTWEKHTKGIGMKLLNKFGFTGRLGAKENGVSRAIEVVVRPNGQGLGFGDFTESSALVVNKKLVAEWSGVEYVEDEATLEAKRAKKIVTEQIADSKSWKKNRKEKQQVKSVKVSDYLDGKAADANSKVVIIDMRGEQTRVLTDYSEMNVVSADEENEAPKLGQELLYNINLVVDLLEIDVTQQSKKLSQETQKVNIITSDITLLESQSGNDLPRLKRLENVMKILDKVAEKQKKELNKKNAEDLLKRDTDDNDMDVECTVIEPEYEITLSAISTLFQTLHKNYTEEFHIFGLIQLLPSLLSPVLQRMFSTWQPLLEPDKMAEIHTAGSALGDYFESIGEHTLRAQTRSIIDKAAQKVTLPPIRSVLTNGWNVHNPDRCIALLEVVGIVYPESVVEDLIDMMVQPKIAAGVKAWSPTSDALPIHTWLHPWLPSMRSKLSAYYPEIRRKLAHALTSWDPTDLSAVSVLKPWCNVFDKDSMEKFLSRVIIPKLITSLRNLSINPSNQDITVFNSVIAWYGILPNIHFVSLFEGEFFSKWLRVLLNWLLISPDFAEISQWYSGWKSCFPATLLEDADMMEPFNTALTLMNIAITAEEDELEEELKKEAFNIKETSYFVCIEKKLSELKARERLEQLNQDNRYVFNQTGDGSAFHGQGPATGRNGSVTFKDVVEAFAANNGVTFMPKAGRMHEGRQIWLFDTSLCYLDQDVVFTFVSENNWRPIGLEELLKLS